MSFWCRLKLGVKKLGPTGKVIFWVSIVAPAISAISLFFVKSCTVNINKTEIDKSQTMTGSPGSIQIHTEAEVNIKTTSPSSPKKLKEGSKRFILKAISQYPEKEIMIKANLGDAKIVPYAKSIKEFIESRTNRIVEIELGVYGNPIVGPDMIHIDREKLEITVSSE